MQIWNYKEKTFELIIAMLVEAAWERNFIEL